MHVMAISEKKETMNSEERGQEPMGEFAGGKSRQRLRHQNIMAKRNKTRQRQQKIL